MAQIVGRMLCVMYVPRWSRNFVASSREVVQVVETAFCLKENPRPFYFITERGLRAYGLAPARSSQAVFVASPSTTMPPLAGETALQLTSDPSSGHGVVKAATFVVFIFVIFPLYLPDYVCFYNGVAYFQGS